MGAGHAIDDMVAAAYFIYHRALRPDWLRRTTRERLGVAAIELDGGHAPHVSRPDELAGILVAHSVG
jgi:hypothetical protein